MNDKSFKAAYQNHQAKKSDLKFVFFQGLNFTWGGVGPKLCVISLW